MSAKKVESNLSLAGTDLIDSLEIDGVIERMQEIDAFAVLARIDPIRIRNYRPGNGSWTIADEAAPYLR